MGLDVALTKTGIALPDGSTLTSSGGQGKKGDLRLSRLHNEVFALAQEHGVTHAILEDLPINAMGAGGTGSAQGVVRLALQQLDIPYVTVVASTLKKYATGTGRADKEQMHAALPAAVRGRVSKSKDDEVDAWWLWHMGMTKLGRTGGIHATREAPSIVKWEGWGL